MLYCFTLECLYFLFRIIIAMIRLVQEVLLKFCCSCIACLETTLLLLLLLLPGILISSSQAYTCYYCYSALDVDCDNPSSSTDTCRGDFCYKSQAETAGRCRMH